jgi:hypothetical protein
VTRQFRMALEDFSASAAEVHSEKKRASPEEEEAAATRMKKTKRGRREAGLFKKIEIYSKMVGFHHLGLPVSYVVLKDF